jgi:hypothetical protein
MKSRILPALVSACLLSAACPACATIVIDNLATGTQSSSLSVSGPTATGFFGNPFNDREVAFSFTTGGTASYLMEFTFAMAIGSSQLSPIQISLSTGSSAPGGTNPVILGSVAPASVTPTSQVLTVLPTLPPLLDANTIYWAHVTVPSGGAIYSFANTDTPVFSSGWSLGTSWSRTPSSAWTELDSGPVARVRMTAEAVPEPTAASLGGIAALLLLGRRRMKS